MFRLPISLIFSLSNNYAATPALLNKVHNQSLFKIKRKDYCMLETAGIRYGSGWMSNVRQGGKGVRAMHALLCLLAVQQVRRWNPSESKIT